MPSALKNGVGAVELLAVEGGEADGVGACCGGYLHFGRFLIDEGAAAFAMV